MLAQKGGFKNISYVFAGDSHSFAVKKDGALFSWGNTSFGKLGLGRKYVESINIPTEMRYKEAIKINHKKTYYQVKWNSCSVKKIQAKNYLP